MDGAASSRFFMDISPEGDPEAPEGDPEGTSPRFIKDVDSSGALDDAIAGTTRVQEEERRMWSERFSRSWSKISCEQEEAVLWQCGMRAGEGRKKEG